MRTIADILWKWPDGLLWRLTSRFAVASRRRRFNLFMEACRPNPSDRVIDVGVGDGAGRALNFFEDMYPYPKQITAVALEPLPRFKTSYPAIRLVVADGRDLPFKDREFDIYISNAVIEHVGTFFDQRRFVHEACRVASTVFISTPYRWFPIDFHTLIPFAHFLPLGWRNRIYHRFGRSYYASEANLRLIDIRELRKMLPPRIRMDVVPQRFLGLVSNLNVVLTHED